MMTRSLVFQTKKIIFRFRDDEQEYTEPTDFTVTIRRTFEDETAAVGMFTKDDLEKLEDGVYRLKYTPGEHGPGHYTARCISTDDDSADQEAAWEVSAGTV